MLILQRCKTLGPRLGAVVMAFALSGGGADSDGGFDGSDRPVSSKAPVSHPVRDPVVGQQVLRFKTFGSEGFWTGAVGLQQGVIAAGVTPIKALQ